MQNAAWAIPLLLLALGKACNFTQRSKPVRMRVICPVCGTAYELPHPMREDAVFVCARCASSFDRTGRLVPPEEPSPPQHAAAQQPLFATSRPAASASAEALQARPRARLAPWLAFVLVLVAAFGAWLHRAQWLARPEVRGLFASLGAQLTPRAQDWALIPEAMHMHRFVRRDESEVLVLEGALRNRLWHAAKPPKLRLRFLDAAGTPVAVWITPLTKRPKLDALLRGPVAPEVDATPVPARGIRGFFLVLEGTPAEASTVEVAPVAQRGPSRASQ